MANRQLFRSTRGPLLPAADAMNRERSIAYAYPPKHLLAQYAATGCLSSTFYADGTEQLNTILSVSRELDASFIAKAAVYARRSALMKDTPALLAAVLSTKDPVLLRKVFPRVVDNARMLRNFVQILRSGVVGRKSLGSAPKALVQGWLNAASERQLLEGSIGTAPSLADVVRMVHPKPADAMRKAFFAWLIGREHVEAELPQALRALADYRRDRSLALPDVPFQMLTALELTREDWVAIARRASWQMTRMNLNNFARKGVFEIEGMAEMVADRLKDRTSIARARVLPYQLLMAYRAAGSEIPAVVRDALQTALEIALEHVEPLAGVVAVCPDVSGSMASPITGFRPGATSAVRCIDVAAMVAAAILRKNPAASVLPFAEAVRAVPLNPRDSVVTNADRLAAIAGGGTNCSAPLAQLAASATRVDLVILVSDNQSWMDASKAGATETMRQWALIKHRNPGAKLVCIDLQPYGTTQAQEREDVLNVGGFSDEVFRVLSHFAAGRSAGGHWVEMIEGMEV